MRPGRGARRLNPEDPSPIAWTHKIWDAQPAAATLCLLRDERTASSRQSRTRGLSYEFPDPRFISFFALHGGVIASALYLTMGAGMRPVPMSILRALAWSAVYLAVTMAVNAIFGTNYSYLRAKPAHASLLDYMAPWPFYIAELALLAILSCLVYYLPFFIMDRLRPR